MAVDNVISITQAKREWLEKYPDTPITDQTMRNWASKYNFGYKSSFLPRSTCFIKSKEFHEFLNTAQNILKEKSK